MTAAEHAIEVKKLSELESQLTQRISLTDDDMLQELFLKWTEQRNVCNVGFMSIILNGLDPKPAKK